MLGYAYIGYIGPQLYTHHIFIFTSVQMVESSSSTGFSVTSTPAHGLEKPLELLCAHAMYGYVWQVNAFVAGMGVYVALVYLCGIYKPGTQVKNTYTFR